MARNRSSTAASRSPRRAAASESARSWSLVRASSKTVAEADAARRVRWSRPCHAMTRAVATARARTTRRGTRGEPPMGMPVRRPSRVSSSQAQNRAQRDGSWL